MEDDGGRYGGGGEGRRSLRYEFSRESNASTAGLTLGGILSIKETTSSYQIQNRTLLDLIRNDPTSGNNDSRKPWKMFREKLRLKLAGSVCTTTVPIVASLVHINTDNNRTTTENGTIRLNSPSVSNSNNNNNSSTSSVAVTRTANSTNPLNSPPLSSTNTSSVQVTQTSTNCLNIPPMSNSNTNTNSNTSSVRDTQTVNVRSETVVEENRDGGDGGGEATVKVSLMRLLEVEGSACFDGVEEEEAVEGGGGEYNNCCVCMVRHKGAAFIPCGHTFCRLCSRELFVKRANCPLCNNFIVEILDIF